jgi:hypothetical protein
MAKRTRQNRDPDDPVFMPLRGGRREAEQLGAPAFFLLD